MTREQWTILYPKYGKRWQDDELLELANRYYDGESMIKIGNRLERTPQSCSDRIRVIKLAARIAKNSSFDFILHVSNRSQ